MTDYSAYHLLEDGPANATADDDAYTMGMEFDVSSPCWLKSIHFWQASGGSPSSATRKALLYQVIDAASGTLLLGPSDFPATAPGWNEYDPGVGNYPELSVGEVYRACVFHPAGRYSAESNYYSSGAGSSPVINGPLRIADADLATGGDQNSFTASATPQFPTSAFNSTRYFISITVTDVDPNIVATNESIADEARRLMLVALSYTVDQAKAKSNVDLMREVVAAGGLSLVTVTSASAAVHYWNYLKTVRDA